jgi:hypothetical protein
LGIYSLKLTATDVNGAKEFLVFKLEVAIPTAVDELKSEVIFRIFPNPVKNNICFDIPGWNEDAEISICNMAGQTVRCIKLAPGLGKIVSMNGIDPGIYIVRYKQGELQKTEKIIKE